MGIAEQNHAGGYVSDDQESVVSDTALSEISNFPPIPPDVPEETESVIEETTGGDVLREEEIFTTEPASDEEHVISDEEPAERDEEPAERDEEPIIVEDLIEGGYISDNESVMSAMSEKATEECKCCEDCTCPEENCKCSCLECPESLRKSESSDYSENGTQKEEESVTEEEKPASIETAKNEARTRFDKSLEKIEKNAKPVKLGNPISTSEKTDDGNMSDTSVSSVMSLPANGGLDDIYISDNEEEKEQEQEEDAGGGDDFAGGAESNPRLVSMLKNKLPVIPDE